MYNTVLPAEDNVCLAPSGSRAFYTMPGRDFERGTALTWQPRGDLFLRTHTPTDILLLRPM